MVLAYDFKLASILSGIYSIGTYAASHSTSTDKSRNKLMCPYWLLVL